jgi:predicted DNA-binding transcriptional regulator AlpA
LPHIPREQQSPYPGGQRAAATPTVPGNNQPDTSANSIRGPPHLWDRPTVLAFFGGIDVSTLYRGVRSGRYPRPVNVSSNVVRWLADECESALARMIAERDEPKPPTRRGRPRRQCRMGPLHKPTMSNR